MTDSRNYVRIAVDLPSNGKMDGLSAPAKWLYVVGLCIAGRDLTDGHIRRQVAQLEAGVVSRYGTELVHAGVWHTMHDSVHHPCAAGCMTPRPGHVYIHDYLEHQRSRSDAERARSAGIAGANARWNADRNADRRKPRADRNSNARARLETEVEVEEESGFRSQSSLGSTGPGSKNGLTDQDLDKIKTILHVSAGWATQVAEDILTRASTPPDNPGRYVLAAVTNEPDRYKPTPIPPVFRSLDNCEIHVGELADNCRGCAADKLAAS